MAEHVTATAEWPSASEHRSNLVGKRKADDEFESPSSISSQFKKLRLNHALSRHTPSPTGVSFRPHIANTDARPAHPIQPEQEPEHEHYGPSPYSHEPPPTMADSDFMTIDDTPHRIIISDLDAEIARIEADEAAAASTIFLPDIDKKVSSIPERLLQSREQASVPENLNTALVLYREPSSISVPEEEDVVRQAIIGARARAREKQAEDRREREKQESLRQKAGLEPHELEVDDAMTDHSSRGDDDLDAMEIE